MSAPCGWSVSQCACGVWGDYSAAVQATASSLAIGVMWMATARRYGQCTVVVQPCVRPALMRDYQTYPVDRADYGGAYVSQGQWHNSCSGSEDNEGCCTGCEVELDGPTSTAGITQVTVDGVIVPPASYLVQNHHLLVRTDGECWPTCVNFSQQAPPQFEVEYLKGSPIPPHVQTALEKLACEWAKACAGGDCALPRRLRSLSRQGVEAVVEELSTRPGEIRTGIPEVDMIIALENPNGLPMAPAVWSPDLPHPRVMT